MFESLVCVPFFSNHVHRPDSETDRFLNKKRNSGFNGLVSQKWLGIRLEKWRVFFKDA